MGIVRVPDKGFLVTNEETMELLKARTRPAISIGASYPSEEPLVRLWIGLWAFGPGDLGGSRFRKTNKAAD